MPRKPTKKSMRTFDLKPYELAYLLDDDSHCRPEVPRDRASLEWMRKGQPGLLFGDRHPKDLWKLFGPEATELFVDNNPGRRPAGWWLYDAPEPRPAGESETDYLRRHGLLTPLEVKRLEKI